MRDADLQSLGVEIRRSGEDLTLRLPRREIGPWRWIAVVPLLLGLGVAAAPLGFVLTALSFDDAFVSVLFLGFALLFLAPGVGLIWVALTVWIGGTRIHLDDRWVVVSEGVGPFRKRWKRELDDLAGVVVGMPQGGVKHKRWRVDDIDPDRLTAATLPGMDGPRSAITLLREGGAEPLLVAPGYRHATLVPVAESIVDQLKADRRIALFERYGDRPVLLSAPLDAATPLSGLANLADDPAAEEAHADGEDIPPQPAGSRCVLETRDHGLTVTVPPAGVLKGSKGLFVFSLIWTLFSLGVATAFGVAQLSDGASLDDLGGLLFVGAILLIFLTVGAVMLAWSIHLGRQRAILDVVGDRLLVSREGLLGQKQEEFAADQIASLAIGPTGTKVNDQPIHALIIRTHAGTTRKLLASLEDDEIRWIAAVLRVALGVPR